MGNLLMFKTGIFPPAIHLTVNKHWHMVIIRTGYL